MFEQAREAMDAGLEGRDANPSSTQTAEATETEVKEPIGGSKQPELTDLEKLDRFKFDGREWTFKDLKNAYLRQSDYTKKTQEIAKEREYISNLTADLEQVRNNPALASEFRRIYPEAYHKYLDLIAPRNTPAAPDPGTAQSTQQPQAQIPKEILDKLQTVDELQHYVREQESRQVETKLEVLSERLSKKYPSADEVSVLATAQALHNQGVKLDDEKWDEIWQAHHNRFEEQYKRRTKQLNEEQQQASRAAKDIAGGGGTPGQGPKPMTFKEAQAAMIKDLQSR